MPTLNSDSQNPEPIQIAPDVFVLHRPGSRYVIEYHRDACIGIGSCAAIAPNTFEMDAENKAVLISRETADPDDLILAAAQSCPVFAIIIKDAASGEQIFPPALLADPV